VLYQYLWAVVESFNFAIRAHHGLKDRPTKLLPLLMAYAIFLAPFCSLVIGHGKIIRRQIHPKSRGYPKICALTGSRTA
jgi:hypothetical protein